MNRLFVAALVTLLGLTGCTSFELSRVRNEVDRTPGVEVGEGYALSFGRMTVGTLRTALRLGNDDEQTRALNAALGHVRKVHVARYRVDRAPELSLVDAPRTVRRYERRGWTQAIAARDDDAAVWLLARDGREGDLRKMLLVTLLPRELIVARLDGRLEDAVAAFAREIDVAGLASDLTGANDSLADSTTTAR